MSRQDEIDRLRAEIDRLRAERDAASGRMETLTKLAFEPDVFLIAKHRATSEMTDDELRTELMELSESCDGLHEREELVVKLEGLRWEIFRVPSLTSFLEKSSTKLQALIVNTEGDVKCLEAVRSFRDGELVSIPTVQLPINCSHQAFKQMSAFSCTGSGEVGNLACAVDLLRLSAALDLQGLAEVASEFIFGKHVLTQASTTQLLQIFDAFHILEKPKDAVFHRMMFKSEVREPRNLNVDHLSAGAMACLLAELPPDTSNTQEAVTAVFKVPIQKRDTWSFDGGLNTLDGPTVYVGTGIDGKPVHMRSTFQFSGDPENMKLGCFSRSVGNELKPLVSWSYGLVHPKDAATTVAARIQPVTGAESLVTTQLSCVPSAISPTMLKCKASGDLTLFRESATSWGCPGLFTPVLNDESVESQLFVQDPQSSEPKRGHVIVQSTFQLKAHSIKLQLLEQWAEAQGYEGTSLSEMLDFCTSNYRMMFDSVLLHHAASGFMSLSAEPEFARLSPDVLLKLLSRDDIESSDEAAVLKAMAPWFRCHDAQDVARVLQKVMLHEVPTSVLKECFSPGGDLHTFRTESVVQVVLADALAAQLNLAKRQREGPDSHINHPDEFLCSITYELMEDPVVCADGHTYERAAVTEWLATHDRSPKCNTPLEHKHLIPNHSMRKQILEYCDRSAVTSARMSKRRKRMGAEAPAAPSVSSVIMELL